MTIVRKHTNTSTEAKSGKLVNLIKPQYINIADYQLI